MESKLAIQVQMPPKAVLRAMLEACIVSLADTPESVIATLGSTDALPTIGAAFQGGLYAGITTHDNMPMALILLPAEEVRGSWQRATEWAEREGGVLPSRFDALVLYQNLRDQFDKDGWYWTDTVRPADADYAFIQSFDLGSQGYVHKDVGYRARAVRRVAI